MCIRDRLCEKAKVVLLENKLSRKKCDSYERGMKNLSKKQNMIVDAMARKSNLSNSKGMRYCNELSLIHI